MTAMANVYLITGGSSEMGTALLRQLLAHENSDDRFLIHGCGDLAAIEELARAHPGQITTYDVDLADEDAQRAFVREIEGQEQVTHFVHLPARNILYINFDEMDIDRFHTDVRLQLDSALYLCKVVLPKMVKAGGGRVVFMTTSILMGAPPAGTTAYTMAKGALYALAKGLASEYGQHGITVNCVAPAMVKTKFVSKAPPDVVQMMIDTNPMRRLGTPDDIAPALEFLLSEGARYITGINLPVTGGFDM